MNTIEIGIAFALGAFATWAFYESWRQAQRPSVNEMDFIDLN